MAAACTTCTCPHQKIKNVAFATCSDIPNLYGDDLVALPAFFDKEVTIRPLIWTEHLEKLEKNEPIEEHYDAIVIRSCWDYHLKRERFEQWLALLAKTNIKVFNPIKVMKWNLNKLYMRDLGVRGVYLPKTIWFPHGSQLATLPSQHPDESLEDQLRENHMDQVVVKPIVSLSAHETWRSSLAEATSHQTRFLRLLHGKDDDTKSLGGVMIQEFIPEIQTTGELSVVFIRGKYSHTVCKLPKEGDFRVQGDFGGKKSQVQPDPEVLETVTHYLNVFGQIIIEKNLIDMNSIDMSEMGFDDQTAAAIKAVLERVLYARVDVVVVENLNLNSTQKKRVLLMELEVIDPELFFKIVPEASEKFAHALVGLLHQR